MPVTSGGAIERDRIAREVIALTKKANYDIGPIQVYEENAFYVFNPSPEEWMYLWSLPEFVTRRQNQGYLKVDAERASKFYKISDNEIDKGNNRVNRSGLILMEARVEVHARAKALPILSAINGVDQDLRDFIAKMGGDAREVDHQRGVVKRNKKGMMSADEKTAIRMKRLEERIKRDMARQENTGLIMATQGTLDSQLKNDPEQFLPQGRTLVNHGGYKEVVLTDDPNRDLEDFE